MSEFDGMRKPRMKVPKGVDGLYHCHSRAVDGKFIFGKREKDKFLEMMWAIADFLGIEVHGYNLMSNHYHQMVFVPGIIELSNTELLGRLGAYYGLDSREYREFNAAMERGDKSPDLLRSQYTRHMGDLSEFEKRLKQGFATWYNKRKNRKGTLWMGRFGSTITEDCPHAAMTMAGYVDLNAVRAGLVDDPKDYPYCGYAAALAGSLRCQEGLKRMMRVESWEEAASAYRVFLMGKGHRLARGKAGRISRELLLKTLARRGHLSLPELLRLRVRYFTEGLVFGSEAFVEKVFEEYPSHFGKKRKVRARLIEELPEAGLSVIQNLRKAVLL